jgi:TolA-binding protein
MNGVSCDRAALVEAMLDRRLGPSEQAATERHLKSCASCTELLHDLTSIREALRSVANPISPLEHQRARLALLRQSAAPSTKKRRPVALLVAALLTLPVAAWAAVSPSSPLRFGDKTPAGTAQSAPAKLGRKHPQGAAVPAPAPPPAAVETSAPATIEAPPSAAPAMPPPAAPAPNPRRTHFEPHAVRAVPAPPTDAPHASRAFAEAMRALSRGDFSASAAELEHFASTYPRDPRVEDAIYLEAIALERAGRSTDAKAAASRYLTLYPDGAHHAQARRIAQN